MTELNQLGATETYASTVLARACARGYPMLALPSGTIPAGEAPWRAWVEGATRRQLAQALGVLVAQQHRQRGVGEVE